LEASLSNLDDILRKTYFQVERDFRPSVLDNIEYLQVFDNDEQLDDFLLNDDEEEDDKVIFIPKDYIQVESFSQKKIMPRIFLKTF
jgi:hypothetical protein